MIKRLACLIFLLFSFHAIVFSQNTNSKWYFGNNAGLDFMTNPPTVLTNGALNTIEGCSSIADATGNLLFYTDGITVYNQLHVPMANGTGLGGDASSSQSAIIVKRPGSSSIYYVFTQSGLPGNGLAYSTVDMTLASGNGSVTAKNVMLAYSCTEKLAATRHCNGVDVWVVTHLWNSNSFNSFLVTASGVNVTVVLSSVGTPHFQPANYAGCMKIANTGKKLGLAIFNTAFELYDFDNTTGIVSNPLSLPNPFGLSLEGYGCEFSPDGTKFYGSRPTSSNGGEIYQWDLCAGSASAVFFSQQTVFSSAFGYAAMQLASNGKIYVVRANEPVLGVINNPNLVGSACNYVDLGQSIAPKTTFWSIPNFVSGFEKTPPPPFTFTVNMGTCNTASFTSPSIPALSPGNCNSPGYSVTGVAWNFDDPGSGAANTSSLLNPIHAFSSSGSFTTQLLIYYSCGRATDTLTQQVVIAGLPTVSVSGTFMICKGQTAFLSVTGASTYSWSTSSTATAISVSPTVTTSYTVTGTAAGNGCADEAVVTVSVSACTGMDQWLNGTLPPDIYPNPNSGNLHVEMQTGVQLLIYNELGLVIFENYFEAGRHSADLSKLNNGLYTVKLISHNHVKTIRLVKSD